MQGNKQNGGVPSSRRYRDKAKQKNNPFHRSYRRDIFEHFISTNHEGPNNGDTDTS